MCFVGKGVSPEIMRNLFDVPHFGAMPEYMVSERGWKMCSLSFSSSSFHHWTVISLNWFVPLLLKSGTLTATIFPC